MSYYVYRFLDEDSNILYVGRTINLENRVGQHFSVRGHIEEECYKKVKYIEYIMLDTEFDMIVKEIYYISSLNPPYNKRHKYKIEGSLLDFKETDQWLHFDMTNIKFKTTFAGEKKRESLEDELVFSEIEKKVKMLLIHSNKTLKSISLEMGVNEKSLSNKLRAGKIRVNELREIAYICGVQLEMNFVLEDGTKI